MPAYGPQTALMTVDFWEEARDVKKHFLRRFFVVVLKGFFCVFFVLFVFFSWPLLSIFNAHFNCLNQIATLNGHIKGVY